MAVFIGSDLAALAPIIQAAASTSFVSPNRLVLPPSLLLPRDKHTKTTTLSSDLASTTLESSQIRTSSPTATSSASTTSSTFTSTSTSTLTSASTSTSTSTPASTSRSPTPQPSRTSATSSNGNPDGPPADQLVAVLVFLAIFVSALAITGFCTIRKHRRRRADLENHPAGMSPALDSQDDPINIRGSSTTYAPLSTHDSQQSLILSRDIELNTTRTRRASHHDVVFNSERPSSIILTSQLEDILG